MTVVEEALKIAINSYIVVDPTLPRAFNTECAKCGHQEAVFFTNPNKVRDPSLRGQHTRIDPLTRVSESFSFCGCLPFETFISSSLPCSSPSSYALTRTHAQGPESMALTFVCCAVGCGFKWDQEEASKRQAPQQPSA